MSIDPLNFRRFSDEQVRHDGEGKERDAVHRVRQRDPAKHRRAEQGEVFRRDQQNCRRQGKL